MTKEDLEQRIDHAQKRVKFQEWQLHLAQKALAELEAERKA